MIKRGKGKKDKSQKAPKFRLADESVKNHKGMTVLYIVLMLAVVAVMIRQLIVGNYYNVFLCVMTLLLFMIPTFVERKLHIDVPNILEIIILLFIFAAEILGEIQEYYIIFPLWDTMLHTVNGFIMAAIGFAMVDILNRSQKVSARLSPVFVALVSFCFSMTIGALWEFFEYGMDMIFSMDMQKDTYISTINSVLLHPENKNSPVYVSVESVEVNGEQWQGYIDIGLHDTMKDMLVNFLGSLIFSVIGMFYIIGRGKGKFAPLFIPRLKRHEVDMEASSAHLLEPIDIDLNTLDEEEKESSAELSENTAPEE